MINYVPFLKTKVNEFSAIKKLNKNIAKNITPFFDIHTKSKDSDNEYGILKEINPTAQYTESEYKNFITERFRKFELNTENIRLFYLDDFDIDDELFVDGKQGYNFVINQFSSMLFIPVVGINRSDDRNNAVFNNKHIIQSNTVAIRLEYEDIENGISEINLLIKKSEIYFSEIELIIDLRVLMQDTNISSCYSTIEKFLSKINYRFSKIIITGSSIPNSITELINKEQKKDIRRKELDLYDLINKSHKGFFYGDYTIISPYYMELDIPIQYFSKNMIAKVIYSHEKCHYICRGKSLQKEGYAQYNEFCKHISNMSFFRGSTYSWGDQFIFESRNKSSGITQSSILAPTINAHITYMYEGFEL